MFALADPERLRELLEDAGFVEPVIEAVDLTRPAADVEDFLEESVDLNAQLADAQRRLSPEQWTEIKARIGVLSEPFSGSEGLRFPARALVAAASA